MLGRSAEQTDGGHPMLFTATVRGARCSTAGQEIRRQKVEDTQALDLMSSCKCHAPRMVRGALLAF